MDFVLVVLIVLLAVVAIGAVIWPILRPVRTKTSSVAADQTLSELLSKREAALRAVKTSSLITRPAKCRVLTIRFMSAT